MAGRATAEAGHQYLIKAGRSPKPEGLTRTATENAVTPSTAQQLTAAAPSQGAWWTGVLPRTSR
ncbi:hypothetical protein ACRAWF_46310 [Streptomyces sp. L7]